MSSDIPVCENQRNFHFVLEFYSDPALTNLVLSLSSKDYYEYFQANGVPMTRLGLPLCELDCVDIRFNLPRVVPPALDVLFNRKLYCKIGKPLIVFNGEVVTTPEKAQIVICVDESGSMDTEHGWIPQMILDLEAGLLEAGVGPNQYALVGFGGFYGPGLNGNPRLITINPGSVFGTAEQAAAFTSYQLNGGIEDGYYGLRFAWESIQPELISSAAMNFIIVTDEDRDILNADNADSIKQLLTESKGLLNVIVNCGFVSSDGRPALGISSDSSVIIDNGTIVERAGGHATYGFGTTIVDYVNLAIQSGGLAWDLNVLRAGGRPAQLFSEAFIQGKIKEITESFTCLVEDEESPITPFYCEREEEDPVIDIPISGVPEGCVHLRMTFYADSDHNQVVTSYFSLHDQKRWYVSNTPVCPMTPKGVVVGENSSVTVKFAPEVLPVEKAREQRKTQIGNNLYEIPLLCGVKYYAKVELYYADTGEFIEFAEYEYIHSCSSVELGKWRKNPDINSWISSGQGKQDFRLSRSSGQGLFPSVSANNTGQFMFAWQDYCNNDKNIRVLDFNPQIWYGIWDTVNDTVWSSGMGRFDYRLFPKGFKPRVTTDISGVFYTSAQIDGNITAYAGPVNEASSSTGSDRLLTDDKFFGLDATQEFSGQYLKARVHSDDQKSSIVLSKDSVVSVVEDCVVRLDIIGVPGVYAVRMRNEEDNSWSDWINIDGKRIDEEESQDDTDEVHEDLDESASAYFIDENRFVVPWILSPGTGMKKVRIQVLTFYGISPTFAVDVLANYAELQYELSFYSDDALTVPLPKYKGYPVVSSSNGTIYVKVEFKDKQRLKFYLTKINAIYKYAGTSLSFNLVQQGINDQYERTLSVVSEGIYKGSFEMGKSDGIYNKDGLAAIVVNVPNPCFKRLGKPCGSDETDPYNLMTLSLLRDFYAKYDKNFADMTPEQLSETYRQSGFSRVTQMTPFKDFYKVDDPRFAFGNPKFFIQQTI